MTRRASPPAPGTATNRREPAGTRNRNEPAGKPAGTRNSNKPAGKPAGTRPQKPMKTLRIAFFWLVLAVAWLPAKVNLAPSKATSWNHATKLHNGVLHLTWKLAEPRPMCIHAVRVDLQTPGLKIVTYTAPENAGKPMPDEPKFIIRTRRQTVNSFLTQLRAPHRQGGRRLWSPR